jgi:hypothetical protein
MNFETGHKKSRFYYSNQITSKPEIWQLNQCRLIFVKILINCCLYGFFKAFRIIPAHEACLGKIG